MTSAGTISVGTSSVGTTSLGVTVTRAASGSEPVMSFVSPGRSTGSGALVTETFCNSALIVSGCASCGLAEETCGLATSGSPGETAGSTCEASGWAAGDATTTDAFGNISTEMATCVGVMLSLGPGSIIDSGSTSPRTTTWAAPAPRAQSGRLSLSISITGGHQRRKFRRCARRRTPIPS